MNNYRVRISNDSLNGYSSRVLTSGLDISQYERNPVVLYMHRRGEVIGYMTNLRKERGEVTGEIVFDEASELSIRCKKQWEKGSLKAVSAGIEIGEVSDEAQLMLPGQENPTVTKSRLMEVSVVDIGANDDALRLSWQGQQLQLAGYGPRALFDNIINQTSKQEEMTQETIALMLGLDKRATEAEIETRTAELVKLAKETEALKAQVKEMKEAAEQRRRKEVEEMIDLAIGENKITKEMRESYITLGMTDNGLAVLRDVLGGMKSKTATAAPQPTKKLMAQIDTTADEPQKAEDQWQKLSDVPANRIMELKAKDEQRYRELYRKEYGMDY